MTAAAILAVLVIGAPATLTAGSADSAPRRVLATANIFGAGSSLAPAPGGGGGGTLPPGWRLEPGTDRVVTFPTITGRVNPIQGLTPENGPEGDGVGSTNVESWLGISGILHAKNGMFLVGVFLGDTEPASPAPPRLDFTHRSGFETLAPAIGQTFLIGDGKGRRYVVPTTATRLYVGFADAAGYQGRPGWYGNNAGQLEVVATGVLDGPGHALDRTPPQLLGTQNRTVTAPKGKKTARVSFLVWGSDTVDGTVAATCTPSSGTFFKLGRSKVACSATDTSGNTREVKFTVTVKRRRS